MSISGQSGRIAEVAFLDRAACITARFLLFTFNRETPAPRSHLGDLTVAEFLELARLRGIRLRPVEDDPELGAFIISHIDLGWVLYFNRRVPRARLRRLLLHELVEQLQEDCPEIECEPPPGSSIDPASFRHKVACRVVERYL